MVLRDRIRHPAAPFADCKFPLSLVLDFTLSSQLPVVPLGGPTLRK